MATENLIISLQADVDKFRRDIKSASSEASTAQNKLEFSLNKVTKAVQDGIKSSAEMATSFKMVNDSVNALNKSLSVAENNMSDFKQEQALLGRTINEQGQVLNQQGRILVKATKEYNSLAGAINNANNAAKQSVPAMKESGDAVNNNSKKIAGLGKQTGMAAVQVEQLVGSVAAGQNPMRAFAFQAADLGIVLGAPLVGAIVGVSASIASLLLPNLFKSKESIDDLLPSIDDLTKEMENLTSKQITFARLKVNDALDSAESSVNQLTNRYKSLSDQVRRQGQFFGVENDRYKELNTARIKQGALLDQEIAKRDKLIQQLKDLNSAEQALISGDKTEKPDRDVSQGTIDKIKENAQNRINLLKKFVGIETQVLEDGESEQIESIRKSAANRESIVTASYQNQIETLKSAGEETKLVEQALSDELERIEKDKNDKINAIREDQDERERARLSNAYEQASQFLQSKAEQARAQQQLISDIESGAITESEARLQTKQQQEIDLINGQYLRILELMGTNQAAVNDLMASINEGEIENLTTQQQAILDLYKKFSDAQVAIKEKQAKQEERIQKQKQRAEAMATLGAGSKLLGAISNVAKKGTDIQKIAAKGSIVASTAAGMMRQYKDLPYPAALATKAAIGLEGLAAWNAVDSESAPSSAGGGSVPVNTSQPEAEEPQIGVTINDISAGELGSTRIIISTEDGADIFDGISKGIQTSQESGRT